MDKIKLMCFSKAIDMIGQAKMGNQELVNAIKHNTEILMQAYQSIDTGKPAEVKDTENKSSQEGEYLGRTLHKKGETNGKEWARYKALVQVGEKVWNFWCFGSTKGFSDINEGDKVKVLYETKDIGDGKSIKNAYMFIKHTDEVQEEAMDELE